VAMPWVCMLILEVPPAGLQSCLTCRQVSSTMAADSAVLSRAC
jgi:hypothetical protein